MVERSKRRIPSISEMFVFRIFGIFGIEKLSVFSDFSIMLFMFIERKQGLGKRRKVR